MKLCEFTIVINSHNYTCTRWICSHCEASVEGHEIFTIRKVTLPPGITYSMCFQHSTVTDFANHK